MSNQKSMPALVESLSGDDRIALQVLTNAALVVTSAFNQGYINADLTLTPEGQNIKPLRNGSIRGIQQGLVGCKADLFEDLDFWRCGDAQRWASRLGIVYADISDLLHKLTKHAPKPIPAKPRKDSIWINPETVGRLLRLPRIATALYLALKAESAERGRLKFTIPIPDLKAKAGVGHDSAAQAIEILRENRIIDAIRQHGKPTQFVLFR